MRLVILLIASIALCGLSAEPGLAQNYSPHPNLVRPLPNGQCPAGTHVVIVNTPLGAQRACST